jgi:hypothetical protein
MIYKGFPDFYEIIMDIIAGGDKVWVFFEIIYANFALDITLQ